VPFFQLGEAWYFDFHSGVIFPPNCLEEILISFVQQSKVEGWDE
jgi:hypothetical protein